MGQGVVLAGEGRQGRDGGGRPGRRIAARGAEDRDQDGEAERAADLLQNPRPAWMCGSAMLTTVASGIVTCANRPPMAQCQEAIAPWERPELGPWLTDPVKLVQYDGIVAYDVSRLSREYFDLAWLRKWAEENHKKLYVIKERLHWPDNRDGTLWGSPPSAPTRSGKTSLNG